MKRLITSIFIAACIVWPAIGLAQNQPTPSGEHAERNAFQTPTASAPGQGEPGFARDKNPLAGSQEPATNPEAKNITEPTGSPSKANPTSPDK